MLRILCSGILLLVLNLLVTSNIYGQKNPQEISRQLQADPSISQFQLNEFSATVSFIAFKNTSTFQSGNSKLLLQKYFSNETSSNDFRSLQVTELKDGLKVEKFKMYHSGIPVEHSSYLVISRNGKILSVNAESYLLDDAFVVQPALTKEQALSQALGFVNAKKYAWEALKDDAANAGAALKQQFEQLRAELTPVGELVIAKDVYGDGSARLAWKFNIYAVEPLGRYNIYIDAMNGKLLLRDMIIKHVDRPVVKTTPKVVRPFISPIDPGSFTNEPEKITASELGVAHTRYAGIRNIYTTRVSVPLGGMPDPNNPSLLLSYSGTDPRIPILLPEQVFILKDDTRGNGIETYDMNAVGGAPVSLPAIHSTSLAFVDRNVLAGSENVWRNEAAGGTNEDHMRGATSNGSIGADEALNDDYALDAHWGAEMVYDYWKNVHNRFSFDNRNSAIKSYVHYGPAYDNAFWNGSVMTYGDGSGTTALGFKPLTSLDVCG